MKKTSNVMCFCSFKITPSVYLQLSGRLSHIFQGQNGSDLILQPSHRDTGVGLRMCILFCVISAQHCLSVHFRWDIFFVVRVSPLGVPLLCDEKYYPRFVFWTVGECRAQSSNRRIGSLIPDPAKPVCRCVLGQDKQPQHCSCSCDYSVNASY